jgi:hypothetical protein
MFGRPATLLATLLFAACSGDDGKPDAPEAPEAGGGGGTESGGGPAASGGRNSTGGRVATATGGRSSTPTGGRTETTTGGRGAVPLTAFTLPVPDGDTPALYHPDLVGDFPEIDFATLDRLYIPAGEYRSVLLGGLPERDPERPLVITNLGGQVKVGGRAANYVFSINGGSGWVLTGRYDEGAELGDAAFPGHANGAYAHSQGSYGILIDDAFSKAGLSGLAIGGGATEFELEYFEVARAEFAGIVAKTDNDGDAMMRNVRVHDLYVHDTGSEGIYFGSTQAQPQHSFESLRIYDNRFLRTGTEALQVGQMGDDCEIHHNVLGPGAVRWRSAFADYQDGNVQYGQRYGNSSFHHNIVIGTGDLFVEFFPTVVDGDPRSPDDTVSFADNYFSDTSASGVYTHADNTGVNLHFERNLFRGFHWTYPEVHPDATEPVQVFGVGSNSPNPHLLRDNIADSPYPFLKWTFPSVTEENNVLASVEPVRFVDFMGDASDENYRKLEWWTDRATRHPEMPPVVYPEGALVVHGGTFYEAIVENAELAPGEHPEAWRELPPPADDVRLAAGSPHEGLGLRAPPP